MKVIYDYYFVLIDRFFLITILCLYTPKQILDNILKMFKLKFLQSVDDMILYSTTTIDVIVLIPPPSPRPGDLPSDLAEQTFTANFCFHSEVCTATCA